MDLHQRLEGLFRQVFNDDAISITDEMSANNFPAWDSVNHINLMFSIEQEFGVRFSGNELAEFKNIGELKSFLSKKMPSL